MLELLLLIGLGGPGTVAPSLPDTIVAVRAGTSLTVENFSGRIHVEGWERDEVDVRPRGGRRREAFLRVGANRVVLRGQGDEERYSYEVRLPVWMDIDLRGADLDATVEGVNGSVQVQTVEGDVTVAGGSGPVDVRAVEGIIRIESIQADVRAWSGDGDVIVVGVRGSVQVESVDGDVVLDDVEGGVVRGTTVDGNVWYAGPIRGPAEIELQTHDGNIEVEATGEIDATVAVSTFDGEFESDFPITVQRFAGGDEFRFTLGAGHARLVLQAFDGSIRLREPR